MTTEHCKACGNRKRPLSWYRFYDAWLCYPCVERKITIGMEMLFTVELR